jgi:hypothetical protein
MTLAENIYDIEVAVQSIVRRGEHTDTTIREALNKIDSGIKLLHQRNRELLKEGTHGEGIRR